MKGKVLSKYLHSTSLHPSTDLTIPIIQICTSFHQKESEVSYLTVSEDGGIVSLKAAFDQMADASVVDVHLAAIHIEDVVIREGFISSEDHLRFARCHRRARPAHIDHLACWLRTNPLVEEGRGKKGREERERRDKNDK